MFERRSRFNIILFILLFKFAKQTSGIFGINGFQTFAIEEQSYPQQVLKVAQTTSVKEILNIYGYPGEEYTLKTKDGYLLEIQRIPNPGGKAILLMHGIRGSAATWVMMGPWSDLAYLLHDNGYDVWLANTRGTRYGQRHVKFTSEQRQFWNFSVHEIGLYDTSAAIDFVLKKSKTERISYVGHSQGAAVFYILTSLRPEYNKKVFVLHALAPAVFMKNLRSGFKQIAKDYLEDQAYDYPYYGYTNDVSYSRICHSNGFARAFCIKMFYRFFGQSAPGALNMTMTPVLLGHYPNQCGIRQIAHYYQLHKSGKFTPFDYSFKLKRRFQAEPYPLYKVSTPSVIFYCGDDLLVDFQDVEHLIDVLPNVIKTKFVRHCSHLDVIISTQARDLFYMDILKIDGDIRNGVY